MGKTGELTEKISGRWNYRDVRVCVQYCKCMSAKGAYDDVS